MSDSNHPNLKKNGRKKLLFLGETGNGKSALCNALSQPVRTDGGNLQQNFPESSNKSIGNTETILKNIDFLGLEQRKTSLIDTVGFNSIQKNNTAVADLIVSLKEYCDYIHIFGIVVSSPKRIEASLKETIELFEGMFGKERFWENAVLIFTNLQQSDDQISRRSGRNNSDEQLKHDFNAVIRKEFKPQKDIPTLIIDAHYDGRRSDEKERFTKSAHELYDILMGSDGTTVRDIKRVVGRYEGLQEKVEQLTIEFKAKEKEAAEMKKLAYGLGSVVVIGAGAATAGAAMVAGPSAMAFAATCGETAVAVATAGAAKVAAGATALAGSEGASLCAAGATAIAGKVIESAARSQM